MRKLTQSEFLSRATQTHNDMYDYSNTVYVNCRTDVVIRCKRCNKEFAQNPLSHLKGCGCRDCSRKDASVKNTGRPNYKAKHLIFGVGVNDLDICVLNNKCYAIWHSILQRTVNKKYKSTHKAYADAEICKEWLVLSKFKKWFDEHYIDGYNIDKDLLGFNSKTYSPDTCVFIPNEINAALTKEKKARDLPIGVMRHKDRFKSACAGNYLGLFDTVDEAFSAYLKAKKEHIIGLANKWKDKIEQRAYNALVNIDIDNFFK